MRVLHIAVALAVSTLPPGTGPGKGAPVISEIAWKAAFGAARANAAGEGKLLFVDFLTDR